MVVKRWGFAAVTERGLTPLISGNSMQFMENQIHDEILSLFFLLEYKKPGYF